MKQFQNLCVKPGVFYLPAEEISMKTWAVVACDQYTAQKEKWEEADRIVGESPSALRLIIPECYLEESEERVPRIQKKMQEYLETGALKRAVEGMVLLRRVTQSGSRLGLIMTIDLEEYSFDRGAAPLIRPTEGTILSRIPPRQRVRRGAEMELAHVLLLCDDPGRTVIEPLYAMREHLRPLYDTELMLEGGHATGWAIEDEETLGRIAAALSALQACLPEKGIFLAVGDGNHSLATAKAHWMEVKKTLPQSEWADHPARFAMVELNNIYDDALVFEPIHRVIFGSTVQHIRALFREAEMTLDMNAPDLVLVSAKGDLPLKIGHPLHPLPVGTVQQLLDQDPELKLDYVHGEAAVRQLVENEDAVAILLPAMDKAMLFPAVEKGGPLPRKTFSMGKANEKRYYIEARKIVREQGRE